LATVAGFGLSFFDCLYDVSFRSRSMIERAYVTRSASEVVVAGMWAALTSISTRMGRLSIFTPFKAEVALIACSCLLKRTVALPRLRPVGPYCSITLRGLPTPAAVAKYSYRVH